MILMLILLNLFQSCCVSILTRKSNFYLKQASSGICISLLNNFPNCDFQFQHTIADWMTKMKFYDNSGTIISLLNIYYM